jgi:hypothetical protein
LKGAIVETVYVVTSGCYSDYSIEAIFSSKEKAEKYMADMKSFKGWTDFNAVSEWVLDEEAGKVVRMQWRAAINLSTGKLESEDSSMALNSPEARGAGKVFENQKYPQNSYAHGWSCVSAEHAAKLAVEARQEWLAKKSLS